VTDRRKERSKRREYESRSVVSTTPQRKGLSHNTNKHTCVASASKCLARPCLNKARSRNADYSAVP
jgi:hypothetical protein